MAEQIATDEHEYVEYQIDIEAGEVVGCRLFGEGRQSEPLTKPVVYMPITGVPWPPGLERIARRVERAFSKLARL
jgi:hypothetical protein